MMKKILLDTHIIIFDGLFPEKLSPCALQTLETVEHVFCADISLWEIAMLVKRQRIPIFQKDIQSLVEDLLAVRNTTVLPITAQIAHLSQEWLHKHVDPADLLIAATAVHHDLPILTKDAKLSQLEGIKAIW